MAAAVSFLGAAVGVVGAAGGGLPLGRTLGVEVAGALWNRIAPAGLGRAAIRVRFLMSAGRTTERALAATALISLVGAAVHLMGVIFAWLAMGKPTSTLATVGTQGGGLALPVLAVLVALAAAALWFATTASGRELRRRWRTRTQRLYLELRELATDGPALTELFVGPIAASAAFVLAFWAAGHAVGIGVGLAPLAFVYLAGTAAANSVPTPGGWASVQLRTERWRRCWYSGWLRSGCPVQPACLPGSGCAGAAR
jgi:uncharacterized membrane protein YbhN (UPF0104 family)